MSRVKRVVAKDDKPGHGYVERRSRSSMEGKRFGKIVVGELVKLPSDRLCKCDCGRTVVMRATTIGLRIKQGLPIDCGQCEEHPKYKRHPAKPRRKKQEELAADNGGRVKSPKIDLPYTPPPPCEVGGLCEHFARCRDERMACIDFSRYNITGENARTDPAPNAYIYDSIYPGVRRQHD